MPDGTNKIAFDPAMLAGMVDFLTVLTTTDGTLLTKQYRFDAAGMLKIQTYDKPYLVAMRVEPVASLGDVARVVGSVGPRSCLVFGKPVAGTDMSNARRCKLAQKDGTAPTLEDTLHHAFPVDVDYDGAPEDHNGAFDPVEDPGRAIEFLCAGRLPYEFTGKSCVWAFSSSAGYKTGIHMRLWFWLDRKLGEAEARRWLRAYIKTKDNPGQAVDPAIYSANQPIYTAAPIFHDGIDDPVAVRSGFHRGAGGDIVKVPVFHDDPPRKETTTAAGNNPHEGPSTRQPITKERLRHLLTWCDPGGPRDEWKKRIIEIARAPLEGGYTVENKAYLRQRCHMFMAGEFYRGDFVDPADAEWRTEEEIDRLFDSAWGKPGDGDNERSFGSLVHTARQAGMPTDDLWSKYADPAQYQTGEAVKPTASGLIRLQRLSEFLKRADPVELITDMMMEGEHCALCGPPKSGKSFLAIDLAMSLASAKPIAGHHHANKHGAVIYLSGEGHAGMRRRLAAWGQHRGLTLDEIEALPFYYNEGVVPADISAEGLEAVIMAIRETVGEDPVMVILDTMSRSLGGLDENASATAAMYLAVTEKLRSRLNTTFVSVVHASNKPGTKQLDIRGSSGFSAGFDAVWGIQKNTDNRTVAMSALWLKEADDLGPFYFRMRLISPEGVAPTKRNTTVVLTYVAQSDMAQEREAREKLLSNRDAVTATLARLGLIGQDKGQTDREFAEASHAPTPAGYIGYLHAKDARDVEAYTAGLAEEARVELQNWLGRVAKTGEMLREGARTKSVRDKSYPPALAGLFNDLPNMRSGGKVERQWFLPAGWKPVSPEPEDF